MARPDDEYEDDTPPQGRERLAGRAQRPSRKERGPRDGDAAGRAGFVSSLLTGQSGTRGLMILAVAGAALLLVIGGVWNWVVGSHPAGVPVIGPPPYAVKDRPADPGGMMIMGDDTTKSDVTGRGAVHLAPPPEQPDAGLLAGRLDQPATNGEEKATAANTTAHKEGEASSLSETKPPSGADNAEAPPMDGETKTEAKQEAVKAPAAQTSAVQEGELPPPAAQDEAPAPASATLYEVQLAALQNEAQARQEWAHLRSRLPDLLGGREPILRTVERDGKHFIRLRVGGFADRAAARQFCVKLHAQAQACAVVTN
ncbi:SPOR domain-containing protein [Bombella saccharophila]|uniref:SPOR domain-containing protein n=1 Tax=Bombella saccharophila TaxID=2967338 RepID=A0ABT3W623_9PROT|nr:SPOR domain-containing protein [Bombella saccharophila]MCX5613834.1 SPOR domain-containing protein [Bombella saccharophila]